MLHITTIIINVHIWKVDNILIINNGQTSEFINYKLLIICNIIIHK